MNVRELIQELIECDMDAEVEIVIKQSNGEEEEFPVESFRNDKVWTNEYARISFETDSRMLVEESEYEGLKNEVDQLQDDLIDAQSEIERLDVE